MSVAAPFLSFNYPIFITCASCSFTVFYGITQS